MTLKRLIVAALVLSLSACGGGQKSTTTTTTTTKAGVSPAPAASMGAMQSQGMMAGGSPAPMPSMDCGGTQPVWVNERSHVFHLAGDMYYGRTKHGKYMCERDAARAGYHPSRK